MKKLMILTALLLPLTAQSDEVRDVAGTTYVCKSKSETSDGEYATFKSDYKQCVREGNWRLPNVNRRGNRESYRYACEKFAIKLNCEVKK